MTTALIYRWMFAKIDPLPLKVWRLAVGSVSLLWWLSNLTHWTRDYTVDGIMRLALTQQALPAWRILELIPGGSWTVFGLGIFVHLLFLANRATRWASLGIWLLHSFLISLNSLAMNSEQYMFLWIFLYGFFVPWTASRRQRPIHSMAVRLFQVHICLIYWISTFWKLRLDPAWFNGESVYYILMHPLWSRVAGQSWVAWSGAAPLMTYSSLLLEGSFAFLIWWRKARPLLVASLIVFHLSLSLIMQHIGFFSLIMVASLLVWTTTQDIEAVLKRISPRRKS
ncbi:MAG: hypothetical protein ACK5P7_11845 [Bdellovibrio sp.]|jgi:hypothetical protein